ncbi:MAG: hypothetical protein ACRC7O_12335 [Fimbriiglobus sp.]
MTLLLTFALVTATTVSLVWAATAFVHPYLFGQPVERLGLRSLASGVLVGGVVAFWTYLNAGAVPQDKFGVIYEFNPTARTEVDAFDAVRTLATKGPDGKHREQTVAFRRLPGTEPPEFVEVTDPAKRFLVNTADYMTSALLLPVGPAGEKVRFDAVLKDGRLDPQNDGFREVGGRRYVERREMPTPVNIPSPWAVVGALLLNLGAFVVWFVVFAPVLRYGLGLALGLAVACGLFMMVVLMPLAFAQNKPKPGAPVPAAAVPTARS